MKNISLIAISLAFIAIASVVVIYFTTPKIGYVRSQYLLENYKGAGEALKKLEDFKETSTKEIDSLRNILRLEFENYKQDSLQYSIKEKLSRKERLRSLQFSFMQAQKKYEDEYQKKDGQLSIGILNQVNDFIQKYAEEKGYDLILTTSEGGSVAYGKEGMDITNDLLSRLNKSYEIE